MAAQELGWREGPTILLDHLSEVKARAFMIADNRLAENASWNDRLLVQHLKELSLAEVDFGIEATGFELSEIDLRTGAAGRLSPLGKRKPRPSAVTIPRQVPPPRDKPVGWRPTVARDGDWWLLGNHRVGCGNLADAVAEMLSGDDRVVVVLAANPAAADAIIRRWQALSGSNARHMASGRGFEEPAVATPAVATIEAADGG